MGFFKLKMKISAKHIKFINLVSTGVSQQEAYLLTSPNKNLTKTTARVEGSKLAKKYANEIQLSREKAAEAVESANDTKDAQDALKTIVNQANADAKIFRILSSDDIVEDIVVVSGKVQVVKRKPTQSEIQKAYELYCKRFGSYAPNQVGHTFNNPLPLTATKEEIKKIANALDNIV
jgi:Ulp1 family protease